MIETKAKKRKVSKKTKKSWRKHVDTTDVDTFLENKRLEERLGAPLSERADSQLFVIDNTVNTKGLAISKYAARLALKNKEPRCFVSLKPHTEIPDPITKRNRVRSKEERMNSILRQREAKRKLNGILKLKEKEALKNREHAKKIFANRPKRGEYSNCIWDITEYNLLPETATEWMSSDSIRHTIKHLGVKKRKLPSSLHKKPSPLPAVEAPHPGTSYNPSYTDHQKLLNEIAQKELELMKQEAHLERVTTQMFKKIPLNNRDEYLIKEMSEGLPIKNQNSVKSKPKMIKENDEDFSTDIVNGKPTKNNKKTLVQRRKQREQKKAVNERSLAKLEKKKISDIYKLKILQKQIEAKERKEIILQQKRIKKRTIESSMPKTLSKTKFEPSDPEFKLIGELTGNLRNCDASKNLLKDRYKSLQQRNIVAPTVRKLKRDKAKIKRFTKPDHKIDLANAL